MFYFYICSSLNSSKIILSLFILLNPDLSLIELISDIFSKSSSFIDEILLLLFVLLTLVYMLISLYIIGFISLELA